MEKIQWKRKGTKEVLKTIEADPVVYLTFPLLEETGILHHGFSTRLGGVSTAQFSSMNFSAKDGDSQENVKENYRRMAQAISVDPHKLVLSQQTHTTNIRVVTEEDAGKGYDRDRDYTDIDGLITNLPGITLVTHYADCVPLFFVDPVHKAIGLSHSGWRGTVGQMGRVTLQKMHECYGTDPSQVIAAIGPSICQSCYEVSQDVADRFMELNQQLNLSGLTIRGESSDWRDFLEEKGGGKYQLNLWEANRRILLSAGVREENIQVTDLCTCCNPQYLFSHRYTHGKRGTMAAFLSLKKDL